MVSAPRISSPSVTAGDQKMVRIPSGSFRMGSDRHYPKEAPAHRVEVGGFWIDRTPVTNADFMQFVRATGYLTFAEIKRRLMTTLVPCRISSAPDRWY
jgi:formylglycine-generating enzyme required for sulfatase activity